MNYADLKLKLNTSTVKVDDNITVLQYLPIEEKNDIIQLALQNAEENGQYNLVELDMYFALYVVYSYSNIEFTVEEKSNAPELYDVLHSNGIINKIINAIPKCEYDYLRSTLEDTLKSKREYRNTIAATLNSFIENLPKNVEEAVKIAKQFKPEDFQRVIDFATAANGNRPIN